jgi:hypothetical protein
VPERLYRLTEAAKILNCSVDLLKWYEVTGKMTFRRELGMRVLTADDLAVIRARRAAAPSRRGRPPKGVAPPRLTDEQTR